MTISRSIPTMKNVSDKRCRENQNKGFMFNKCFSENYAVYDKVKKYDRAGWATSQYNKA